MDRSRTKPSEQFFLPICATCGAIFSKDQLPLSLPCRHHLCAGCLDEVTVGNSGICPFDDQTFTLKSVNLSVLVAFKAVEIRYYLELIGKKTRNSAELALLEKLLTNALGYTHRVMNLTLVPCWTQLLFGRCKDTVHCGYDHQLTKFKQQLCKGYHSATCPKSMCFFKHGETDVSFSGQETRSRWDSMSSEEEAADRGKWVITVRRGVCRGRFYTVGKAVWVQTGTNGSQQ